jgi:hypothetical protein
MSPDPVRAVYDDLAATYDLIYPDWAASSRAQAAALDLLLRPAIGRSGRRVLDCAAGIGRRRDRRADGDGERHPARRGTRRQPARLRPDSCRAARSMPPSSTD